MEDIASKNNSLCVHLRKLASSRSYREETGEFLCDSPKLLREAALWGAELRALLCTEGAELTWWWSGTRTAKTQSSTSNAGTGAGAPSCP